MGAALESMLGAGAAHGVFGTAGLDRYLDTPPQTMVGESEVIRLHAALRQALAAPAAHEVTHRAGLATGDYLLSHRIPRPAQALLRILPRPLASRLLIAAVERHAWTFTGSGALRVERGSAPVLVIENCAICRAAHAASPLCGYYAATFERLFRRLVDPGATVIETDCAAVTGHDCRFQVCWA
jgi:divinyl protochlorophyllide a 8-vinyl-reductase